MGSFTLRRGTIDDLDALVTLEKQGFAADAFDRDQLRYLLERAHGVFFVLEEDLQVRGSAVVLWRRGRTAARLYSLVVDPACQNRGLGERLLAACEQAARKQGYRRLSLEVRGGNARARRFYQQRGYQLVEELPGYYGDGGNGLRMVKELPFSGEGERPPET